MNSKTVTIFVLVLALFGGLLFYWQNIREREIAVLAEKTAGSSKQTQQAPAADKEQAGSLKFDWFGRFKGKSADWLMEHRPEIRKVTEYPPRDPKDIELWQWWHAINKADPSFEWKMPVNFYGRVVDQTESPVPNARIEWHMNTVNGTQSGILHSAVDGRFELVGQTGKGLTLSVGAAEYISGREGIGSYEYAAFHDENFHIPDPARPIIFRLYKYQNPEPMHFFQIPPKNIPIDGTPVWIDIRKGTVGENGQMAIAVRKSPPLGARDSSYVLTITMAPGAGLSLTNDEFMFHAPDSGYQSGWQISSEPKKGGKISQEPQFYLRTQDGKYAAISVHISQYNTTDAGITADIYYNPSGSRNLEFDNKHILPNSR